MTMLLRPLHYVTLSLVLSASLTACSTNEPSHRARASAINEHQKIAPAPQPQLAVTQHFQQTQADPTQLLNRLTWGANASSAAQLNAVGMDGYLRLQLQAKTALVPAPIQAQIDGLTISKQPFDLMMIALNEQRKTAAAMKGTDDTLRKAYQQELNRLAKEAASRSLLRAVYSSNQLLEQMDWFWMNHFNISNRKENLRAMLGDFEENAIRPHALGNFRDLLRATVLHPAMLRYLDNEHNAHDKINENYARELMELHTMGVGSGYTQIDVQELARVLTGLGINISAEQPKAKIAQQMNYGRFGLVEFNPKRHDFGDKKILGVTIKGNGIAELDQILMLLTRQPATAKFVSKKMAMYFVSDAPSDALVAMMAQRFLQTDGDIPSVLKTMFDSTEFIASLGKKFKDPMHYVLSSVRLAYDGSTIINTGPIMNWLNTLGQQQNGHQTPDGYSMNETAWASPAQMTARFDIAKMIARGAPALFRAEGDDDKKALNAVTLELARPALAQNPYAKNLTKSFSSNSQEALIQATSPQEWNSFFLATPEMMRR